MAIGKYKPIRCLGVGAMGVVDLCSQPGLGRSVAVKVMIAGPFRADPMATEKTMVRVADLSTPLSLDVTDKK